MQRIAIDGLCRTKIHQHSVKRTISWTSWDPQNSANPSSMLIPKRRLFRHLSWPSGWNVNRCRWWVFNSKRPKKLARQLDVTMVHNSKGLYPANITNLDNLDNTPSADSKQLTLTATWWANLDVKVDFWGIGWLWYFAVGSLIALDWCQSALSSGRGIVIVFSDAFSIDEAKGQIEIQNEKRNLPPVIKHCK